MKTRRSPEGGGDGFTEATSNVGEGAGAWGKAATQREIVRITARIGRISCLDSGGLKRFRIRYPGKPKHVLRFGWPTVVGGRTIHAWDGNIVESQVDAELRAV